ncbi:MAG: phosphoglycerate kinase [Patescibacteria group bacterium]
MKFLKDLSKKEIAGKTCLLRIDLNIAEKEARNSSRILGILPTIKFLTDNGAKVVILSHRGRPKPVKWANSKSKILNSKEFSLKPFVKILSKLLNKQIKFVDFNKNWKEIAATINGSKNNIFLLENLRFLVGEEKNNPKLAKQLANLGDMYVNDAFAVSHRANASVEAITKFLPSCAGFLLEREIKNLSAMMKPKKPLVIILGGAKISDKIGLIENFIERADYFLIGGGIAHNFLLAQGLPIGDSIFEEKTVEFAKKILNNKKVILPVDYKIKNRKILDIGPNTISLYENIIKKAKTIIWNGPMGYFENPKFAKGSEGIVKAIINNKKAFSIIGGGETTSLLRSAQINADKNADKRRYPRLFISTGGGAMLEYLAGKKLPGIKALE